VLTKSVWFAVAKFLHAVGRISGHGMGFGPVEMLRGDAQKEARDKNTQNLQNVFPVDGFIWIVFWIRVGWVLT